MTTQDFSIAYRAPNLVDVLMPKQNGVEGYRLRASPQFDGTPAFVTILTASIGAGFLDPAVNRGKLSTMPGTNHVRAVFDPDTFAAGEPIDAGLIDTRQFWMRFQPIAAGVPGAESDPVLILTRSQLSGESTIAIQGDAPSAATIAGSLTLCLARRMVGFSITNNDGSNPLFVAFNVDGPETRIPANTRAYFDTVLPTSILVVRGSGGAVSFSAEFTVLVKR